jgi:putative glutamine amidotransferase
MSLPVIGITTYGRDDRDRYSAPVDYCDAVLRAGGLPLLIPPGSPHPERYLDALDGVILAGGGDIDPEIYGGNAHETIYSVDRARDALELALARELLRREQPVFGICRGMQVINVALGGTLIEHLPEEVGENVVHRGPPRTPTPHPVTLKAGSRLAGIAGATELAPLSWHHQAIRVVAPGLEVVGQAPDGTIEAIEAISHPWLIAVQWHPELSAATDRGQQAMFDALVAAAGAARRGWPG